MTNKPGQFHSPPPVTAFPSRSRAGGLECSTPAAALFSGEILCKTPHVEVTAPKVRTQGLESWRYSRPWLCPGLAPPRLISQPGLNPVGPQPADWKIPGLPCNSHQGAVGSSAGSAPEQQTAEVPGQTLCPPCKPRGSVHMKGPPRGSAGSASAQ